jgi:hypothetical protein
MLNLIFYSFYPSIYIALKPNPRPPPAPNWFEPIYYVLILHTASSSWKMFGVSNDQMTKSRGDRRDSAAFYSQDIYFLYIEIVSIID